MVSSIVRYSGINTSGTCGYCTSTNRAKARFGEREEDGRSSDGDEEGLGEKSSVNFGVIAHLLSVVVFNQILDIGWSSDDAMELAGDLMNKRLYFSVLKAGVCFNGQSEIPGLWAHRLSVSVYMDLLDLGWRRSGRYLYKPIQELTCCPQYTIRLDVHKLTLSRSQKRVLNTMLHFLRGGEVPAMPGGDKAGNASAGARLDGRPSTRREDKPMASVGSSQQQFVKSTRSQNTASSSAYDEKKRGEKKKVARRRRAEERLRQKGIDLERYRAERAAKEEARRRTIESFLPHYDPASWKHQLEVRLVALHSEEFAAKFDESFALYRKYQACVHEDDEDELTPDGYTRFLASSPLFTSESEDDGRAPALGSYHQHYVLDGRIIAVGVVDILPRCFSSKYFYYDPAYKFLSLGTYSALREIAYTRELCSNGRSELHHYYMGFYLYDCPKMRYKGGFRPSDLLCDRTHQWVPLSECLKLLDASGGSFTPFAQQQGEGMPHDDAANDEDINKIRCLLGNSVVSFGVLRGITHNQEESLVERVRTYLKYAGHVAEKIVICF